MATRLQLDMPYDRCVHRGARRFRTASQMSGPWRGSAFNWDAGTITLMPVCYLEDYHNNPKYNGVKMGLIEMIYDTGSWRESELNRFYQASDPGMIESDNWFNCIVPADKQTEQAPQLYNLPAISQLVSTFPNFNGDDPSNLVSLLSTKAEQEENAGFVIRWRMNREAQQTAGTLWVAQFGQFLLRVTGRGVAYLYQDFKGSGLALVKTGVWRGTAHVLDNAEFRCIIYPHARNCVEIRFDEEGRQYLGRMNAIKAWINAPFIPFEESFRSYSESMVYWLPVTDELKPPYHITTRARFTMAFSTQFRPLVQIAHLQFVPQSGVLFDDPMPLTEPAYIDPTFRVLCDNNGGAVSGSFYNAVSVNGAASPPPFQGDGKMSVPQFGFFMQIASTSTSYAAKSPELYGYSFVLPSVIEKDETDPVDVAVMDSRVTLCSEMENQHATVTVDNSLGQVEAFRRRSYIPFALYDDQTHVVYMEGFFTTVRFTQCPSETPDRATFTGVGFHDPLMREYIYDLDFTINSAGNQWLWGDAVIEAFAHAGFAPEEVLIEDRDLYDFPLWPEGDMNSSASGSSGPSAPSQRWRPNPNAPIFEWLDAVIRQTLGWTWERRRRKPILSSTGDFEGYSTSHWLLWKRPRPSQVKLIDPSAAFFSNPAALKAFKTANPDVPCYLHSRLEQENKAPLCTAIDGATTLSGIKANEAAVKARAVAQIHGQYIGDGELMKRDGYLVAKWENKNGFKRRGVEPEKGPDYMGRSITRLVNLTNAGTVDAFSWIGRRIYEDQCFGKIERTFEADWGDITTAYLRKWDKILIDPPSAYTKGEPGMGEHLVTEVNPAWRYDVVRRAEYRAWEVREDAAPPR